MNQPEAKFTEALAGNDVPTAVKSADRVLDLFELLAGWSQGMTHSDIAEALKIPKSSLSQLLKNLIARGYVAYVAEHKAYVLGERFAEMARQTSQRRQLVGLVQPKLTEITSVTGESSAFNVLHGDDTRVVATADSPQRLVTQMRLGDLAPLYATSSGKAILAFMPEKFREEYLARVVFERITAKTLSSRVMLERQLEKIRRDRLAEVHEEFTLGIIGFAVPVLASDGKVLGAVNVAMPAVRHTGKLQNLVACTLRQAAAELENHLTRSPAGAVTRASQKGAEAAARRAQAGGSSARKQKPQKL